ncbi:hypothetical protein [Dryocola sp. BD613]|uniref:hypothetical protein n=1 Tax=Dryocola sp. BD613 TaxID=3133272 RepID=UPI003F4FBBA7
MTVNKLLTLKDVPGIFHAVRTGRKSSVLSDADFRQRSMACGCPAYLLATEITMLLHYATDLNQKMFIATLANTGIGISMAGALTPSSFVLNTRYPCLHYFSSGKRHNGEIKDTNKTAREEHIIPLVNEGYVMQLRKLISVHTPKDIAKKNRPLWAINSVKAEEWINNAVSRAQMDGVHFCFAITADILRRSFAVGMLTLGIHPDSLKRMIYTENAVSAVNEITKMP